MTGDKLQMDAMRLQGIEILNPKLRFNHVLPLPRSTQRNELYVFAVNKSVVLEVEMGILGQEHVKQLLNFLNSSHPQGSDTQHIRTDGKETWIVSSNKQTSRQASEVEAFVSTTASDSSLTDHSASECT